MLGPNGAGKTTLIKCLSGLIIPDKGEIFINGKLTDPNDRNYLKDISVVLEGARNLYWRASVKSNFYYFGALKGIGRSEINTNIEKIDELFGIKHLLTRRVNTLSLGQKQKVAILCNILLNPRLLILDEPSNGLDINKRKLLLYFNLLKCKVILQY